MYIKDGFSRCTLYAPRLYVLHSHLRTLEPNQ